MRDKEVCVKFCKLDHPFPNEELMLMSKLHQEGKIDYQELKILSNLLQKYLSLRADVFHNY